MSGAAAEFSQLLEREREAALRADLDALAQIQEQKRRVIERLRGADTQGTVTDELVSLAESNIGLIRHLVACLRGCLSGNAEPTYTASGLRPIAPARGSRGAL